MIFVIKADQSLEGDDRRCVIQAIRDACAMYGNLWAQDVARMIFGGEWTTNVAIIDCDPVEAFAAMKCELEALDCEVLELTCECQLAEHFHV